MEQKLSKEDIQEALCSRHSRKIQQRLDAARVMVAGLGGLGSNIAAALVRIGVGHLHLIDFDRVDITNLNRQHYFIRHLGMDKTEALREQLQQINPYLDIRTTCARVTEENLPQMCRDAEIICEAFDDPCAKAMLVNGVLERFPEKKLVAASGMAGFGDSNAIHTRQVWKNFYLCGDERTEPEYGRGLMAPRVAICAAHQANMITRLILEDELY